MSPRAVILAGGQGRRLLPYTSVLPKPLMPLGDRPILEIVVGQIRRAGFTRITLAVGHLASLIQAYFEDGAKFGVQIDYSREQEPLGTAGPLSLIVPPTEDILVMNGDVLTDLDYAGFYAAHQRSGALATIAAYRRQLDISLGVVELDPDDRVVKYTEKPSYYHWVSTGIYCFRPEIVSHLQPGVRCDLPDLIKTLMARGESVRAHRIGGYWLDIGRPEDYELAQREYEAGRFG